MTDQWLTITETEKKTGIPPRTLRRYVLYHGQHIHMRRLNRMYEFTPEMMDVFKRIRDWYAHGFTVEQVE
ncbi:MAG: MerR family transcriptional regulator, partial [Firmicutes bacterium]|nr:MerR family transcriptional regulator [Bacillota bacterium]